MFGRDVLDVRRLHYPRSATNPTFAAARRGDWLRRNWNKHPLGLVAGAVSGHGQRGAASVSGAPMAHGWNNFFIMAGSSAATLIGLLFVAIRNRDQTH